MFKKLFLSILSPIFLVSFAQASYKSASFELVLDDDSSKEIFRIRERMRQTIRNEHSIFKHHGSEFDITYGSSNSYPHVTLEIFKKTGGESMSPNDLGRLRAFSRKWRDSDFSNHFSAIQRSEKADVFAPSITQRGLRLWSQNLVFMAQFSDKKPSNYWKNQDASNFFAPGGKPPIETVHYDWNTIDELLNVEAKDLVAVNVVLKCMDDWSPAETTLLEDLRLRINQGIKADKYMSQDLEVSHPRDETVYHVSLLKLKAVRSEKHDQYRAEGGKLPRNADILFDIPNQKNRETFKRIAGIFKKLQKTVFEDFDENHQYSHQPIPLDCDTLVINPWKIKVGASGSSPDVAPQRTQTWKWGNIDLPKDGPAVKDNMNPLPELSEDEKAANEIGLSLEEYMFLKSAQMAEELGKEEENSMENFAFAQQFQETEKVEELDPLVQELVQEMGFSSIEELDDNSYLELQFAFNLPPRG